MPTATNSFGLTFYADGRVMLSHHIGSGKKGKVTHLLPNSKAAYDFIANAERETAKTAFFKRPDPPHTN